jgi:hypothetical protein
MHAASVHAGIPTVGALSAPVTLKAAAWYQLLGAGGGLLSGLHATDAPLAFDAARRCGSRRSSWTPPLTRWRRRCRRRSAATSRCAGPLHIQRMHAKVLSHAGATRATGYQAGRALRMHRRTARAGR